MTTRPDATPATRHSARTIVGTALGIALPLAALAWAWRASHTTPTTAPGDTGGHDHMAMMGRDSSGGSTPVMLNADQQRRIGVTFAPVVRSELGREVRTVGQVTVDEARLATIASRVEGWVEVLHVDFTGRTVTRGEPVLRLYAPTVVTALEELRRARRLVTEVAEGSTDARTGALDLVAAARNRLLQWEVPVTLVDQAERTGVVERAMTMTAPVSGVVVEKNVTVGQRIMPGDPLFRLADLREVWVEGEVYEQDLRAVRVGQRAAATFDAWPGETWTGRIAWIAPTLSPETRTARVRVALRNEAMRLKPGMAATLTIAGTTSGVPTLVVPRTAVLVTGERALVFVKGHDGRLEPRTVTLGYTTHESIEILRGVALGDTVVASATFLVDAESNLGTALGGMGDMPGMEITQPPTPGPASPAPRAPAPRKE